MGRVASGLGSFEVHKGSTKSVDLVVEFLSLLEEANMGPPKVRGASGRSGVLVGHAEPFNVRRVASGPGFFEAEAAVAMVVGDLGKETPVIKGLGNPDHLVVNFGATLGLKAVGGRGGMGFGGLLAVVMALGVELFVFDIYWVLGAHRTVRTQGNTGVGREDLNKMGLEGVLSILLDGVVESVDVFDVPVGAIVGGEWLLLASQLCSVVPSIVPLSWPFCGVE